MTSQARLTLVVVSERWLRAGSACEYLLCIQLEGYAPSCVCEVVEQAGVSQFARVIVKGTCVAGAAAYTVGDWVPLQLDEPLVATTDGAWIGMPAAKHHEQPAFWAMFRAKTTPSMMDMS